MNHARTAAGTLAGALVAAAPVLAGDLMEFRYQPRREYAELAAGGRQSIARDTFFHLRLGAWITDADGEFKYGERIGTSRSRVDLEDHLNLDTEELVFVGEFGFTLVGRHHLDFRFNGPFSYKGQSPVATDITFGDRRFSGVLDSELEYMLLEADYRYDAVETERLEVGIGGGLRVFAITAEIEGTATDRAGNTLGRVRSEENVLIPVPVLGITGRFDLTRNFFLRGSANGIYLGEYAEMFDLSAEAGWDFHRNFGIFAGYRYLHVDSEVDADDADFEFEANLHGPFAGLEIRF